MSPVSRMGQGDGLRRSDPDHGGGRPVQVRGESARTRRRPRVCMIPEGVIWQLEGAVDVLGRRQGLHQYNM